MSNVKITNGSNVRVQKTSVEFQHIVYQGLIYEDMSLYFSYDLWIPVIGALDALIVMVILGLMSCCCCRCCPVYQQAMHQADYTRRRSVPASSWKPSGGRHNRDNVWYIGNPYGFRVLGLGNATLGHMRTLIHDSETATPEHARRMGNTYDSAAVEHARRLGNTYDSAALEHGGRMDNTYDSAALEHARRMDNTYDSAALEHAQRMGNYSVFPGHA